MSDFPDLFIAIDEHGRVFKNEVRVEDQNILQSFFSNMDVSETGAVLSKFANENCIVEAFDSPWVVIDLTFENNHFTLVNTYGFTTQASPRNCYFDEWDRLHGLNEKGIPWVLSRFAQEKFFDLLDEYDDESFMIGGEKFTPQSAFYLES